ncbi:16S rRNA (uracil(1498)-N(3))-methyltransferase [uncultured Chloroflexus sp.]|uniref:16S rRNA (uracil(1498)-N(3))-methyltransferase n=1 Tax=uncultured Chloroflexus sp. TaxID=214040 RepID=UPI0026181060|nr:16S rRNA (uracil(1498)-N(3))-methyltransferase [uncultured Chloroflexus sp.]
MPRRPRDTVHSNTYRFFVAPSAFDAGRVRLFDPDLAHQLANVLRLGRGDRVVLLDGEGWQYTVALETVDRRGTVSGAIESREVAGGEPRLALTIYLPIIRAERFEWALQKGVELGAAAFVPILCTRSIDAPPDERRLVRWRRIIREAAEQSRRGRLPHLAATLTFAEACTQSTPASPALLLWEGDNATPLAAALHTLRRDASPATLGIFSGPEGGLTDDERSYAERHGIMRVSLGPRTLRAETAPIVATAIIMYELG